MFLLDSTETPLSGTSEASLSESPEEIFKSSLTYLLTFFLCQCICILLKAPVGDSFYQV